MPVYNCQMCSGPADRIHSGKSWCATCSSPGYPVRFTPVPITDITYSNIYEKCAGCRSLKTRRLYYGIRWCTGCCNYATPIRTVSPSAPVAQVSTSVAAVAQSSPPAATSAKPSKSARRRFQPPVTRFQVRMVPSGALVGVLSGGIQPVTSSQAIRFVTEFQAASWAGEKLRGKPFTIEPVEVDESCPVEPDNVISSNKSAP